MKKKNIFVWVKEPHKPAEQKTIPNTLKALQEAVGGNIESYTFSDDAVILCDEEGWLKNYPPNVKLMGGVFYGNIVLAGVDGDEFTDFPIGEEWRMRYIFPMLFEAGEKQ